MKDYEIMVSNVWENNTEGEVFYENGRRMKTILKVVIAIGMILISLVIWSYDSFDFNKHIESKKGRLDMSDWDFSKNGEIRLNGEWEFYDNQLLTPNDFKGKGQEKPQLTGYRNLTSTRLNRKNESDINPIGVKTYRMVITVKPSDKVYGLKLENIRMSSRVFINDRITESSGNPEEKDKGYLSRMAPYDVYFNTIGDKVEIILQTANYDYPFSRNLYKINFGLKKQISFMTATNFAIELASSITTFFFCIYYLTMYSIRKTDKSYLYWGVCLLLLFLGILLNGQQILSQLIPSIPYLYLSKVNFLVNTLLVTSLVLLMREMRKTIISDKLINRVKKLVCIYVVLILISSNYVNVLLSTVVFGAIPLFVLYLIIKLIIEIIINKERDSEEKENILFLNCVIGVFICLVNNYLFSVSIVYSKGIGSIAVSASIVFMAVIISYKFFLAYKNMEKIAEELIKIDKVKDEFLTKTSYELKYPLYGIISITETVLKKKESLGENTSDIEMVRSMARRLSRLINNTLDFTLIKNNQLKVNIGKVDIMICINLVIDVFDYIIRNKSIKMVNSIKESLIVKGDESKIGQVIFNLINNSIKNMDKGRIDISYYKFKGEVYIIIEDTGTGIPKDMREKIFLPYESGWGSGIGLGLYISQRLMELMGGRLYLDWSEVDRGSRFILTLPYIEEKKKLSHRSVSEIQSQYAATLSSINVDDKIEILGTILIVEDEIENALAGVNILRREGYNVIVAMSKDEIVEKIRENNIDLVILDLIMPGASGIDMCKEIKEKYLTVEIPIVISTVKNSNYELDLALKSGANDIIIKPFEEKELIARVKTLIALKKYMEEALKSELAFLQAQIKPHFIYNTLSVIISLCYTNGEKAAELLTCFSKYLRFTFDMDYNSMHTSLKNELEAIEAYVEIEKARFGEKINVEYDVDPLVINDEIPSFYIQPLVENAIKHGLYEKENGGTVWVSVKKDNGKIYISVKDNGVGITEEKLKGLNNIDSNDISVGLSNIRKRAKRLNEADINIYSVKGEGTKVTITFKTI